MIFFDTDCLSSFFWVDEEKLLVDIQLGCLVVPRQVIDELSNPSVPHLGKKIQDLLAKELVSPGEILAGSEAADLFYEMAYQPERGLYPIGKGEAAVLALAKVNGGVVASNNLKDIGVYLRKYRLRNIRTGYILAKALNQGLITEDTGNLIWQRMLKRRRILPTNSFSSYLKHCYAGDQEAASRES